MNEAHIKLASQINPVIGETITISFTDISTLTVNNKDSGKTVVTAVVSTIGIIAVVSLAVYAIASCPFVYVENNGEFVFIGELYPGVITKNSQRDDYIALPSFKSSDSTYVLRITNELMEVQHTDFVQLVKVDHHEDVEVLMDKHGNVHSFSSKSPPNSAIEDSSLDVLNTVLNEDGNFYSFDELENNDKAIRSVILDFDKPLESNQGKLFLTVKNTMWLDYLFGKFNEQFGIYYNTFQRDLQKESAEKSRGKIKAEHLRRLKSELHQEL